MTLVAPAPGTLLGGAALLAAVAHLAMLGVLVQAGAMLMAVANLGTVLLYLVLWLLARLGLGRRVAQPLVGAEALANAVLAVVLLGWNSEFAACIAALLALVAAFNIWRQRARLLPTLLVVGLYGSLALLNDSRLLPAEHPAIAASPVAYGLHLFNLVCLVFLPVSSGGFYQRVVSRILLMVSRHRSIDRASGLPNRQHTLALLRHQLKVAGLSRPRRSSERASQPITAVLAYVELVGESKAVLAPSMASKIAETLRRGLRAEDSLGRWSGHHFLVILPGTDTATARIATERLRAQIRALHLRSPDSGAVCAVNLRLGVAPAMAGDEAEDLVERCEGALRAAKAASRRRRQMAAKLAAQSAEVAQSSQGATMGA